MELQTRHTARATSYAPDYLGMMDSLIREQRTQRTQHAQSWHKSGYIARNKARANRRKRALRLLIGDVAEVLQVVFSAMAFIGGFAILLEH